MSSAIKPFKRLADPRKGFAGFTLIEILVAISILILLTVILAGISNVASRTWMDGEKRVETSQSGRAILDMMDRDLAGAIVGPAWQFVQNPTLPAMTPAQAANTDSLFWQTISNPTESGNISIVGYFVVRDETARVFELRCLRIAQDDARYPSTLNPPSKTRTSQSTATWVASLGTAAYEVSGNTPTCSTVAEGVVAMWIRCLDSTGAAIAWWTDSVASVGSEKMKFNSAATFLSGDGTSTLMPSAFNYTASSASYMPRGDSLPAFVELTVVIVDTATIKRGIPIPAPPAVTGPQDVPVQIAAYRQSLVDAGIPSTRVFSTRCKTKNPPL